jgi:hypothetical protein
MRKKTATVTTPAAAKPVSRPKVTAVTVPDNQAACRQRPSEETIRLRAYQKWESAGMPGGDGLNFWLEAEQDLLRSM